jgi:hypothetical protein
MRCLAALADPAPRAAFNQALALLEQGDFAAGWRLYQARIDHPDWVPWAVLESVHRHRGRMLRPGDKLDGRRIVVFTEQGLGDSIMFARYLPMLAARGAHVTLACPPALRPLFARVDGIATLLSPPPDRPDGQLNLSAVRFDSFAPIASLPFVFGTAAETIPASVPYMRADTDEVAAWRARYRAAGRPVHRRVGVVFQTNPEGRAAALRSMPLEAAARLSDVPGIIDATAEPVALDRFAAAIAATDVLIGVDTMAINLAGATGHPVWVALSEAPSWQWALADAACPWYPTATLFRAAALGGWDGVVAALCRMCAALGDPDAGF